MADHSALAGETSTNINTVIPRPEAHMDMILFEVFLKNIHLIPQRSDSSMTLSMI